MLGSRGNPPLRAGVEEGESGFTAKVLPARAHAPDGAKTIGVQEGESRHAGRSLNRSKRVNCGASPGKGRAKQEGEGL
jgi:hypothetical protein